MIFYIKDTKSTQILSTIISFFITMHVFPALNTILFIYINRIKPYLPQLHPTDEEHKFAYDHNSQGRFNIRKGVQLLLRYL